MKFNFILYSYIVRGGDLISFISVNYIIIKFLIVYLVIRFTSKTGLT